MKLSEYKNEEALELLADIMDPLSDIMTDENFKKLLSEEKTTKMGMIQYLLRNQSKPIIAILARMENTPVEEFQVNILSLTTKLLDVFNDKELVDFFKSQGQMVAGEPSGSATENTEETEEA